MHESDASFSLVTVASGARSLRSLEHGETFHPVVGPMAEARGLHVAQSRLAGRAGECARPFVVWDVGLGAGANAVAAIEALAAAPLPARAELHSFDRTPAPLEFALRHSGELAYFGALTDAAARLLSDGRAAVANVDWHLHLGDFQEAVRQRRIAVTAPDAILYDPYSPAANPGMWSLEHFVRLHACLDPARPCTLTSYSRSTSVRVTLALAGFFIGRGGATGEKEETTVAATHRELLTHPLGAEWLPRVERSTRAAPLREGADAGPITPEDFAALRERLSHR